MSISRELFGGDPFNRNYDIIEEYGSDDDGSEYEEYTDELKISQRDISYLHQLVKEYDYIDDIIKQNIDPLQVDEYGNSIILLILIEEKYDLLKETLRRYPQLIFVRDKYGNLPIHHSPNNSDVLLTLLKYYPEGACQLNDNGDTPLHLIIETETPSLKAIQILVDFYPEAINQRNYENITPLDIAENLGHIKIIDYLRGI